MALDNKYHIKIGDFGFILARDVRLNRHLYARDEAPAFVNKFSSGEPNYRDASFFSHFVQLDFLNGLGQEFFDDPSRFFYSEGLDITKIQELTLEKRFASAGQLTSGIYGKTQVAWRASATSYFGDGSDGALTISADTTEAPIDSTASGTQGSTTLSATNASFAAGQKILIHQTRGINAGSWQVTEIQSYSAGTITTVDPLTTTFSTSGNSAAQVRVLKQYSSVTIDVSKTYTAKAWDGSVGGILAFFCNGTVTINGTITATGKGFRGGAATASAVPGQQGESGSGVGTNSTSANASGGGGGDDGDGASAGGGAGGGHGASGSNGANGARSGGTGGSSDGNASLTDLRFGGAGGAGGSRSGQGANGGAGGNSGGIIFIAGKTVTMGGSSSVANAGSNGSNATGSSGGGGGGGAGGAIMLKVQTATLGTTLITAAAGSAGSGSGGGNGGAGAVGRIHIDYLTSFTGTTTPTIDSAQDGTLTDTPLSSSYTHLVGASDGKIYSWDGASTYTELFDTRRSTWNDTVSLVDGLRTVGDSGGTENAAAQSFQVVAASKMKAVQVYIKKQAGTPGDITVRIETQGASKPSGTLVDSNATATIPAFSTTSYGWVTVEFPAAFSLNAATVYWIVLKTAAASNDNNYAWGADTSSPTYTSGNDAYSTDGGSTWTAASNDLMFRVLGPSTTVNCSIASDITATMKAYFGTGDPSGVNNGDAKVFSYDGTNFALVKTFNDTNESSVNSMIEYGATRTIYFGLGHKAKIYSTTNMTSFTLAKTINEPENPGHVLAMAVYGGVLYVGGGYPEQLYGNNTQYSGFLYSFDEYDWIQVGTFEHTVITCLESFDTLLFIGTINKRLYVFNTATIEKLFEFKQDMQITSMAKWNDKLAIATAPRPGTSVSTHEGIYIFDRNGLHKAYYVSSRSWYSLFVFNNNLMGANDDGYIYQSSSTTYLDDGWLQTSYFEAQLPSIDKLFRDVTIQHDELLAGTSIQIYYRFSEDDSWTSLGTSDTDGDTEKVLTFPVATYAKRISFKIVLATSNTANTPVFKKIIMKYQLAPDFQYIWKMTVVCPDSMQWLDGTEPTSTMTSGCSANDTTLLLDDADGMPDPNGSTFQASVLDSNGAVVDTFTYTGKSGDTLSGIPSSGSYALGTHAAGTRVAVMGRDLHKNLLNLKQTKKFYTFTDIDGNTYTTYFHSFQTDGWAIDVSAGKDVLENEVPITLLEA